MFFEANFPTGYMGSELAPGHPIVTFNDEENTITIEATATIPTRFMGVAGVHEMSVSSRTVIQRELQGMELVLVMDNTGSMRGNGGMAAMKPAAEELIEILYGDRDEVENFYVGLVPFAATVNIGSRSRRLADRLRRRRLLADHLERLRRGPGVSQRQQRRPAGRRGVAPVPVGEHAPQVLEQRVLRPRATRPSRTATTTVWTTTATRFPSAATTSGIRPGRSRR